jgi:hypothetical protein
MPEEATSGRISGNALRASGMARGMAVAPGKCQEARAGEMRRSAAQ